MITVLAAAIGAAVLAVAVWLIRDEIRRQNPDRHADSRCTHPEPWMAVCPCGWESRPQPSERDARTAYDRHVIAELERIS